MRDVDLGVDADIDGRKGERQVVLDVRDGNRIDIQSRGEFPVSFVDLGAEYRALKDEIDAAMAEVIDRGDFVLGAAVDDLERRFAAFCGTAYAIGVDSGWSALELTLRAHGIGPGDEVITAANTFMATAGAIEAAGARPVLVDCDPDTYNLDPVLIDAAVTKRTAAIIPVHLYGRPADMRPIVAVARSRGLVVIEDACQAHGAWYHGTRAGALGDAAAFSFYPAKNLGGFGDGGMVVTDSAEVAERVRLLRNLGSPVKYQHTTRGFNRRLDTLQAAVLGVKLGVLDDGNGRRRKAAEAYGALLSDFPIVTPFETPEVASVHHLYVIRCEDRDGMRRHLDERGVATGIHYPIPIHLQEAFAHLGGERGDFPVTEYLADRILSLPMHPNIEMDDIARVVTAIRSFYDRPIQAVVEVGAAWN
jgi:dTDP-4-amino-4,6-dideoxygalactose transaminase